MRALSKAIVLVLSLFVAGMVSAQSKPMAVLVGTAAANDTQAAIMAKFAELMEANPRMAPVIELLKPDIANYGKHS